MCLCSEIRRLADSLEVAHSPDLAAELNEHLAAVRKILLRSKPLARDVRYQVVPNNQRTAKILAVRSINLEVTAGVHSTFDNDVRGFWEAAAISDAHNRLRRRVACVVAFLRSKLDTKEWLSPSLRGIIRETNMSELRYAGNKYIKMARKLGGIGSILWLPLDVPSSTYERYLNMDDEETFAHLASIGASAPSRDEFVQRLILYQLEVSDTPPTLSYFNLLPDYRDLLPVSQQVLMLMAALGGSEIPVVVLKSVREPAKRWTADGEIKNINANAFGLPDELVQVLCDDDALEKAVARPEVDQKSLDDGTLVWTLAPEFTTSVSSCLSRHTEEVWASSALRLLCFACPPCYEGKSKWTGLLKKAFWLLLEKCAKKRKIGPSLKTQVIDSCLFLCERDLFQVRHDATILARETLTNSMPYYYSASVVLFESIILRLEGSLEKSDARIHSFLAEDHAVVTRSDNALRGRLHISHIENKIQRYDKDVAAHMYKWEGIHPLSTFEIEVTRRLQGIAAKYFHFVGDFRTARASLEQHLWLNSANPIRPNTRILMTTRLAEINCELDEFARAIALLGPEIEAIPTPNRVGRPYRRLLLVWVDAKIGQGALDEARITLQELERIEPQNFDDINDQMLHMRRLILLARVAHDSMDLQAALQAWTYTLQRMEEMTVFKVRHKWTAAVLHLSLAHIQLTLGDHEAGKLSWDSAVEISRGERYEYVVPVFATSWLRKVAGAIHSQWGWSLRVMLPGGQPDMTWP